jgi:hypothetical protein
VDDRTITLENDDMDISYLQIFEYNDYTGAMCNLTVTMAADNTKLDGTAAYQSDYIQDISTTGEFEVGSALNSGAAGTQFHYIAIGE